MKFKFLSDPISQISYNVRNNNYLVSTWSNGGGADDYSLTIQTFTAIVEVGRIRVYKGQYHIIYFKYFLKCYRVMGRRYNIWMTQL